MNRSVCAACRRSLRLALRVDSELTKLRPSLAPSSKNLDQAGVQILSTRLSAGRRHYGSACTPCRDTSITAQRTFGNGIPAQSRTYATETTRKSGKRRYATSNVTTSLEQVSKPMSYAIALGSNMGDRLDWIEKACREMEAAGLRILATSGLFQTTAMYVEDQDDFLNGVCMIETELQPLELMKVLQGIENKLGRVKVIDKGPRNIDLDIVLWEGGRFSSDEPDLHIPHKLMLEREFVLTPLAQILPSKARGKLGVQRKQARRGDVNFKEPEIGPRTPLCKDLALIAPKQADKRTHVMSILNLTPDSFSDGGRHDISDEEYLRSTILSHLGDGATIIDLGAQSSRPGAVDITAEEEISRLMPALKVLTELRQESSTPPFSISIDTYRASVAEAAVNAGADIINDISAGALDPEMLPTVARLGCTYILMHMRGTPATMSNRENCTYDGDMLDVIKSELLDRVAAAEDAGIRRWRMILDPGIGFAKTASQNLEILRRLGAFTNMKFGKSFGKTIGGTWRTLDGLPWLVGASRKKFVGTVTGVGKAEERTWGTAATVTAAVQGGADIVRVHDVREMAQVAKTSDAIFRVPFRQSLTSIAT